MAGREPASNKRSVSEKQREGGAASQDGGLGLSTINPSVHCRTAHEYVRRTLRQAILSGFLPGGTRLVQAEVAAELQVSTTPVREALRDLATEEIIHLDAHRGAVVREIDLTEVREVYELRMLLEPFAVRKAATNVSSDEFDRFAELCKRMEETEDSAEWTQLNRDFHTRLVEAAERPKLTSILSNLTDTAAAFVAFAVRADPSLRQTGSEEHQELLDALERGDADKAATVTAQHLQSTLNVLEGLGGANDGDAHA